MRVRFTIDDDIAAQLHRVCGRTGRPFESTIAAETLARSEGLEAHANAVRLRLDRAPAPEAA